MKLPRLGPAAPRISGSRPVLAVWALLTVVLALLAAPAGAKSISLPSENLTLEVPDDWQFQLTPLLELSAAPKPILSAASSDHAEFVLMVCDNLQQFPANDPVLIANIKANANRISVAHGNLIQFTGDQAIQFGGVPAHSMQYTLTLLDGKILFCRTYSVAGNDRLYLVLTQSPSAERDQAVHQIVSTLHFDAVPHLPHRPWSRRLIAAVAIAVMVVVAGISGLVAWLINRRRA